MKKISIFAPCFNEEDNILEFYRRVTAVIENIPKYTFEIVLIDNASTDNTVSILREISKNDRRLKFIVNTRNFGQVRSPFWGFMQTTGDAAICLASDLQDPPEFIPEFIKYWEQGYKVVWGIKPTSSTSWVMHRLRKFYYYFLSKISEVEVIQNATGFGLYDRCVLEEMRKINDPYPYVRGMVCELGYEIKTIAFNQPKRERGLSKNNFYTLYDIAMLGIVSQSMVPIRFASILGLMISCISFVIALIYLILKIIYWNDFAIGIAPLVIGIFFMFGMIFLLLGLLGEYIGSIQGYLKNRPMVVERERVGFD